MSVEDCCLAVGKVVVISEFSASRMKVKKENELVEHGVIIDDTLTAVLPLSLPSKKVTISNVPPLIQALSCYGKLISLIFLKITIGCESPLKQ